MFLTVPLTLPLSCVAWGKLAEPWTSEPPAQWALGNLQWHGAGRGQGSKPSCSTPSWVAPDGPLNLSVPQFPNRQKEASNTNVGHLGRSREALERVISVTACKPWGYGSAPVEGCPGAQEGGCGCQEPSAVTQTQVACQAEARRVQPRILSHRAREAGLGETGGCYTCFSIRMK